MIDARVNCMAYIAIEAKKDMAWELGVIVDALGIAHLTWHRVLSDPPVLVSACDATELRVTKGDWIP